MLSEENRKLYFLLLCIPIRIILAIIPIYLNKEYLPYFGLIIGIMGINMLYLYFNNLRLNAFEGGGKTWWANYRLLHGALYIVAAIYAYQQNYIAWIPLFIDACLGIVLHIVHHDYLPIS